MRVLKKNFSFFASIEKYIFFAAWEKPALLKEFFLFGMWGIFKIFLEFWFHEGDFCNLGKNLLKFLIILALKVLVGVIS